MACTLELKVVPRSGIQKWVLDKSGTLKCHIKSPPEGGKANRELIALIADVLNIPQKDISIIMGVSDRKKVIKVQANITREEFLEKVGIGLSGQKTIW